MSSLARRSLRTAAAAAGIAAIGVGFAGHAIAAPEVPALPGADALGALALPDAGALPDVFGGVPAAPSTDMANLPQVFTFEGPTVNTATPALPQADLPQAPEAGLPDAPAAPGVQEAPAAPGLPAAPAAPAAPALPQTPGTEALAGIVNVDGGMDQVSGPEVDPQSAMENNRVGAMPSLDTAKMFAEMAQKAMAGGSVTEGNSIGG
jgi:hypothetical protein